MMSDGMTDARYETDGHPLIYNSCISETTIRPTHYAQLKIQPEDYIEANLMDFFEGNVIKYVSRYKYKNGVEDLRKASHNLDKLIKRMIIDNV